MFKICVFSHILFNTIPFPTFLPEASTVYDSFRHRCCTTLTPVCVFFMFHVVSVYISWSSNKLTGFNSNRYLHAAFFLGGGGTPRGCWGNLFRLCSSLVHSLPHLLLCFTFFLFSFTLLIFFYCPSHPFLPESSHSVSRREVVGGDRTWV